jgi:hypothetical protein
MATFPDLEPQSRSYTPGSYPVVYLQTLTGRDATIRQTNGLINTILRLQFIDSGLEKQNEIFNHYAIHDRFQSFDLPDSTLRNADLTLPTDYLWIYAKPPEVSYDPGQVVVSVELQLVPPYSI